MAIATTCPNCDAVFRLADNLAGRTVRCQKCAQTFTVPKESPPPPVLPVADSKDGIIASLPKAQLPPKVSDSGKKSGSSKTKARGAAPAKSGGGMMVLLFVLLGGGLLGCFGCAGVFGYMILGGSDQRKEIAILKKDKAIDPAHDAFKDRFAGNDAVKDRLVDKNPEPPRDGIKDKVDDRPNDVKDRPLDPKKDDGGKDKKGVAPMPVPVPVAGAFPIVFGGDGAYRHAGQLDAQDPLFVPGTPLVRHKHKLYSFQAEANHTYQIDLIASPHFDAYLFVLNDAGAILSQDDDGGDGLNSRILFRPNAAGPHRIVATSLGGASVGPYSFTVRRFTPGTDPANAPPLLVEQRDLSYRAFTPKFNELPIAATWARDGKSYYLLKQNGHLVRINAASGVVEKQHNLARFISTASLSLSSAGLVAALYTERQVWVIDPDDLGAVKRKIDVPGLTRLTAGADASTAVALTSAANQVVIIDLNSGQVGFPVPLNADARTASLTPDGRYLFVGKNGTLTRHRIDRTNVAFEDAGPQIFGYLPEPVRISPDSKYVCAAGTAVFKAPPNHAPRGTYIYSVANIRTPAITLDGVQAPRQVGIDPRGGFVYVHDYRKSLTVFNLQGQKRGEYDLPSVGGSQVRELHVSPNGREILMRTYERLVHVKMTMP